MVQIILKSVSFSSSLKFLNHLKQIQEMKWNANLMQLGNFIDIFLARHVSGTYAPSSGALDVKLQHTVFCTEFLDGWWS